MNRLSRRQKRAVFYGVDASLSPMIALAALLSGAVPGGLHLWAVFPMLMVIAGAASAFTGLPRIKLNAYELHAVVATAKFACLTTAGFCVVCQATGLRTTGLGLAVFMMALLLATVGSRFIMLFCLRWALRNGRQRCRVLIYGAGETGLQILAALRNCPHLQPVAFLDDDMDLHAITVGGLPVLPPARVAAIAEKQRIDRVYLALPSVTSEKIARITISLKKFGLNVQHMPTFPQLSGAGFKPEPQLESALGAIMGRVAVGDDIAVDDAAYRGRVILVSGAGGSVGSELCRQLLLHQPRLLVLYERSELALYEIERELRAACGEVALRAVLGSITDAKQARATMSELGVDVVFHAAAYKHVPLVEANPIAGLSNNVIGTRVFADAAIAAGVGQFVLVSTDKAVRPTSVMGASKRFAELVIQDLARRVQTTAFSIVRFGNVLGSSGSVLPIFREQITRGGPVTLTDENVTRYFMTLSEAARLVLAAGAFGAPEDQSQANVFVLDMGQPVRIRDLAERMIAAAGLTVRDKNHPEGDIDIIVTGLRPGEKLHEELFIQDKFLPTPHPKILRASERCLSEFATAAAMKSLRDAIAEGDQTAARLVLQTWVEGFPQAAGREMCRVVQGVSTASASACVPEPTNRWPAEASAI